MNESNRIRDERLDKVQRLREEGVNPFANQFKPNASCLEIHQHADAHGMPDMSELGDDAQTYRIAGRLIAINRMGKASFMRLRDGSVGQSEKGPQNLQIYLRRDIVSEETWALYRTGLDLGDFVGIEGRLFATRTGEPTLMVDQLTLLTKSIRPLPDKFHGLSDQETRFRQRYVDLIANTEARQTFRERAFIVDQVRDFLKGRDYMEVETPMMHVIPGGASARPFVTHHHALDMSLYLRVAPELYLKRLLVGGFERVFELNRNFRNEGVSTRHNPEFTMLEFYEAYATFEDLITLTEEMLSGIAAKLSEREGLETRYTRPFGEHTIDWSPPFARYTVKESLVAVAGFPEDALRDADTLRAACIERGLNPSKGAPYGLILVEAFDAFVEANLIQPTFITHYPVENSPLARRNEADPTVTDRFELFAAGNEIANAFSELNDPIDQKGRFEAQVEAREAGDDEAMYMDLDYIRALEYGMPPAAGQGIGIDRLVMLMTNKTSIREVLLFPHMRPEG